LPALPERSRRLAQAAALFLCAARGGRLRVPRGVVMM
jgi:hypothetical protein